MGTEQLHLRVLVVDASDTMVHAWGLIEASGAEAVAVAHRPSAAARPTWTVWRSDDLLELPPSLHLSGLRHVGPLLSLARRSGIETWPQGTRPPTDRAVLLVSDGHPVALVLPADDPTGTRVFEHHVDLPPDLDTSPPAPIPMDGSAGDDQPDQAVEQPEEGAGETGADDDRAGAGGGWWERGPDEADGPVRGGGGEWATSARPTDPFPDAGVTAPPPPAAARPPSPPPAPTQIPAPASPPPTPTPSPAPTPPPVPPDDEVRLHPFLDAPERIDGGARATISVGVGAEAQPGLATSGPAMALRATPQGEVVLEVVVVAEGFTVLGARQQLRVPRDHPDATRLTITVQADEVAEPTTTRIEVQYGQDGSLVGRAWREVVVAPPGVTVAGGVDSGAVPVMAGGDTKADLTVMAVAGQAPQTMLWTFFSPLDVALPDDAVPWDFPTGSARDFALQQVLKMAQATTSPLSDEEMAGISRVVADALPPTFWELLAEVAAIRDGTQADDGSADGGREGDGPASILLVTDEPWVPWELAATDSDYLPPEVVDPDQPAFLGAQFSMGRWLVPKRRGRVESPTMPPPASHDVAGLALVVGDYAASRNFRPLPEAEAEGTLLASRYPSSRWTATSQDLGRLLADEDADAVVDVLHMACHGTVDAANTQWSGIVLSDDEDRLSPLMIRGAVMPRTHRPLVFLNACQVGQGTDGMSDSGSLGAAFVREGATGFIAPLWEVDDDLASTLAADFYRDTLDDGLSVGEAMRRGRAKWDPSASTRLAYVYWGHPGLRLHLHQPPAGGPSEEDTDG